MYTMAAPDQEWRGGCIGIRDDIIELFTVVFSGGKMLVVFASAIFPIQSVYCWVCFSCLWKNVGVTKRLRSPTDVVLSPVSSDTMAVAYRWRGRRGCQFQRFRGVSPI